MFVYVERPIHYSESVVDVTMRWARWPGEFRHGNYLIVKPATVYSEIEQVVCVSLCVRVCLFVSLSKYIFMISGMAEECFC